MNWATESAKHIVHHLQSDSKKGLASDKIFRLQEEFGRNVLARSKRLPGMFILLSQFKSTLIVILLVASGVSFALQHHTDAGVILAAVILNVVVGFIQEYRAERALEALQRVVTFTATVIRDGKTQSIRPTELVVGDIVKLSAGSKVPADIRLLEVDKLSANEAPLTGESLPVNKTAEALKSAVVITEKNNMVFFGTTIVGGSGMGIVVAVGENSEIGKIAMLLSKTRQDETPLQLKLKRFSKTIAWVILAVSVVLFVIGISLGTDFVQMFTTAVALAVAAIPEGLVVVMTVILALGMQRILKQKALVRKLVAAETLGSTSVICTDKTGTLTEGEMHVVRVLTEHHDVNIFGSETAGKHPESIFMALRYGLLASDAYIENPTDAIHGWKIYGNPTERALVSAAGKFGIFHDKIKDEFPRLDVVPFNSDIKYMATLHGHKDGNIIIIKGAPERVLQYTTYRHTEQKNIHLTAEAKHLLQKEYEKLSSEGLRILAIGYKKTDIEKFSNVDEQLQDLIFLGFFCLQDPLREDVKETIKQTQASGIKVVMLTGDHKLTAQAIAKELGLPSENRNVVDGPTLEGMTKEELDKKITQLTVYARVSPKDKLRIIDAWQRKGFVVAMTGDGVNDAPALKSADIGIALGSGTDVAKETAVMILLQNNFSVIVHAIEEGRVIFANIKKVILYLMSDSFTEVILISLSMFFGLPLPLLASQILWVNLVSDGLPAIALTFEKKEGEVMRDKPIPRKEPIFTKSMRNIIIAVSLTTAIAAGILFYGYMELTGDLARARTVTFLAVSLDSLIYAFSVRVLRKPIWRQNPFSNPYLIGAIILAFIVQMAAIYLPFFQRVLYTTVPQGVDWLVVLGFMLVGTLTFEIMKDIHNKKNPGVMV